MNESVFHQYKAIPKIYITQYRRMHHYLNDEWEHYKNELVYDQLQKNIEVGE